MRRKLDLEGKEKLARSRRMRLVQGRGGAKYCVMLADSRVWCGDGAEGEESRERGAWMGRLRSVH